MTAEKVISLLRTTARVLTTLAPIVVDAVIEAVQRLKRGSRKS